MTTKNILRAGEWLYFNEKLISSNRRFELQNQKGRGLVLVDTSNGSEPWANRPPRRGPKTGHLQLQGDGNLVLSFSGQVAWASDTHGRGTSDMYLIMHDDGNLILRLSATDTWQTNTRRPDATVPADPGPLKPPQPAGPFTSGSNKLLQNQYMVPGHILRSPNGNFTAEFDSTGQLTLEGKAWPNHRIWRSEQGPRRNPDWRLTMQIDGNLVMSAGSEIAWATGTNTIYNQEKYLQITDGGTLEIIGGGKRWLVGYDLPLIQNPRLSKLSLGQSMLVGQKLTSPNGEFAATFTETGRFHVTRTKDGSTHRYYYCKININWALVCTFEKNQYGTPDVLMENDEGEVHWSAQPDIRRLPKLDDANHFMRHRDNLQKWFGSDAPPNEHAFMLMNSGNLVTWWTDNITNGVTWFATDLFSGQTEEWPDRLRTGDILTSETCLVSKNKKYRCLYEANGRLGIFSSSNYSFREWSIPWKEERVAGKILQNEYGTVENKDLWDNFIWQSKGNNWADKYERTETVMEDSGKLVSYGYPQGKVLWTSH